MPKTLNFSGSKRFLVVAATMSMANYVGSSHAVEALQPPRTERIAEIAKILDPKPHGYGPACRNREAWQDPRIARILDRYVGVANGLLQSPFPAWNDEAYLDFSRTGRRDRGEQMMQARLAWLAPLVFAECIEYKGRFTAAINETLIELVRQKTWTLPAHDSQLHNYRGDAFDVDLAAAQQANEIAQALYMIGDSLPKATRDEAETAIRVRVLDPVRKSIQTGQG